MSGSSDGVVVLIFGSTGTAGKGAVRACLDHAQVREVRAVVRRPLGLTHEKLREVRCSDFADLSAIAGDFEGVDCCLFCLGTSVRNVPDEDRYREIHVTYAVVAAEAVLRANPGATFVYLSGSGAKRTSRMMWARVKAEAEDELAELGLTRLANARPGWIAPSEPTGLNRRVVQPLVGLLPTLGILAVELGQAMIDLCLDPSWSGARTLEHRDLRAVLRGTSPGPGSPST